jgi:glycosyltransferase involved in cell wall biosynthesis
MINVLINAYAIRPASGSEPGMGWNWVVHLAKHCNLYIITEGEWKDEVDAAVELLPQRENLHFYYLPVTEKVREMCWNQGQWLFYLHYQNWQKRVLPLAEEIISNHRIDIIHQLNMVGFREPGYLWKIRDIPFVWGPVGGMENMPLRYIRDAGFGKQAIVLVKNLLNTLQVKYHRRVRKAMFRAGQLIASGEGIKRIIFREFGLQSVTMNETGCFPSTTSWEPAPDDSTFSVVWVGKFFYSKQLGLALRVIAALKQLKGLQFHIIGTGSEVDVKRYQQLADELGIQAMCVWHGKMGNKKVHEMMHSSHIMLFTSVMEATSTVILEAISNNLPVVCFNTCGFGPLIDESIGCRVELSDPQTSIREFKEKIEYLYTHRQVLHKMSENCSVKRNGELSWPVKAERMLQVYEKLVSKRFE